jgi:transposase
LPRLLKDPRTFIISVRLSLSLYTLYEILEQRGFEVLLVNAHDRHNVRGRKRDVSDCEWLRELHSVGRLRASFRPAAAIVPLRSFLRQRETLVEETTTRINRMHKALTEMNLKLDSVLTDINQTGLRIIRAILGEERNPEQLAAHRDHRCHASQAEIVAALTGNYRAEQLFALKQNFAAYEFLLQQVAECDAEIEALLTSLAAQQPPPPTALPPTRSKARPQHGQPRFEIRSPLQQLSGGVDLSQIDAIGPHAALQLVAEIGTDMHRWQTEKHFTSWLALAPNNRVSGGRRLSSQDSLIRQPRRRHLAPLCDEPHPHRDRARRILPAPSNPHRQTQGHHRHRP